MGTRMGTGEGRAEERRRSAARNRTRIVDAIGHFYSVRVMISADRGQRLRAHPIAPFARHGACTHASHQGGYRVRGTGRIERGRDRGRERRRTRGRGERGRGWSGNGKGGEGDRRSARWERERERGRGGDGDGLNAMKRFLSLQLLIPPECFDIFPPDWGCSESL